MLAALGPSVACCTSGPVYLVLAAHLSWTVRSCIRNAVVGPIAVASGVTIDNVNSLRPCVDVFMVATGIEQRSSQETRKKLRSSKKLP